jgi:hypothetical protein
MAAAAKAAIWEELASLRIEELSDRELTIRGEAIRNRTFAPYLREQREQAELRDYATRQEAVPSASVGSMADKLRDALGRRDG